ncbi:MAG TPA: ABC transporter ATP-binding protein [Acidimicrobiia bacterium]|nr:ABC transporter ATP-binding protein [Acidimicrobiia bacterium]
MTAPAPDPARTPTGAAIEVVDLVKDFAGALALDGVSFAVPRGQVCALLGPNGAGKTTTIHILLGLTLPTAGTARILGHDVTRERSLALRRTNFTASYVQLPARLRVHEILRIFAEYYEVDDAKGAVEEAITLFRIEHLRHQRAQLLSSGQQTLVGLAKAFVNRPEVLFLDEPTASLDPEHAFEVRNTLRRVASDQGMTILITSHNMVEIERIADRVLLISNGRLVADASPAQLRDEYQAADLEEVFLTVARQGRNARRHPITEGGQP